MSEPTSAAEVLAQHQVSTSWRAGHDGWTGCTCDPDVLCDAQHQLEALKAANIGVVELPADDARALEHFEFGGGGVRQYDPSGFGSYRWFSFDEIRTLAPALLAMLAAADAAEATR